jgi:hypothetical protein
MLNTTDWATNKNLKINANEIKDDEVKADNSIREKIDAHTDLCNYYQLYGLWFTLVFGHTIFALA